MLDLGGAVIISLPGTLIVEEKAIDTLIEEVEKRARIRWTRAKDPSADFPLIFVG